MPLKIIIIHGTGGKPDGNWFPWLKQELTKTGQQVIIPTFPTIKGQSLQSWIESFQVQVGSVEPNMILVGHSIGAGFLLNLLEQAAQPVIASYFVAGFLGELNLPAYDSVNESFVCRDFNWPKIRKNAGNSCVINSDNDPYVPLSKGEELAKQLAVPLTLLPGAGHINDESGFTSFPFLLEKMQPLL